MSYMLRHVAAHALLNQSGFLWTADWHVFVLLVFSSVHYRMVLQASWLCWMKSAGSPKPQTRPLWRKWFRSRDQIPSSRNPRNSRTTLISALCTMLERSVVITLCWWIFEIFYVCLFLLFSVQRVSDKNTCTVLQNKPRYQDINLRLQLFEHHLKMKLSSGAGGLQSRWVADEEHGSSEWVCGQFAQPVYWQIYCGLVERQ